MKSIRHTLVLFAALAVSASGMAMPPGPERPGADRQAPPGMEVVERLHHALRRLDLDPDQRESIRAEMEQLRATTRPTIEHMHRSRAALHELLLAADYDARAVADVAQAQGEAMTQLITATSESVHRVMTMLTDGQRAELIKMREQRQDRMEERLERLERRLDRMQDAGDA